MKKSRNILRSNWMVLAGLVLLWPSGWVVQDSGWINDYAARIIMLIGIRMTAAVSLQLINGISGQFSLGHAGFMAIGAYAAAYPAIHYSRQMTSPLASAGFYVSLFCVVGIVAGVLYGIYRLILLSQRLMASAPAILALGLLFWIVVDLSIGGVVWTDAFRNVGRLYEWLVAGLVPIGDRLGAGIPATLAVAMSYLIDLSAGGMLAAGAGLMVGVPALRLKGDYLAIATLGFAEIIRVLVTASDALKGATGMTGIPQVPGFAWVYGLALVATVCVWRLVHSARGRAMLAVREDEIASASVGIDPARSRVLAFVVGAFFAGAAGGALAHYEGYIAPENFGFMQSVELVVIVILAGAGSITGTLLVTAVLTWLPEGLRGFSEYRMILYSLMLIGLMLVRPEGILGKGELVFRRRGRAAV